MKFTLETLESRCAPCSILDVPPTVSIVIQEGNDPLDISDKISNEKYYPSDKEGDMFSIQDGIAIVKSPDFDGHFERSDELFDFSYRIYNKDDQECSFSRKLYIKLKYVSSDVKQFSPMDINEDDVIDIKDVDGFFKAVQLKSGRDLNNDGIISIEDVDEVIKNAGGKNKCDINLDGTFNSGDWIPAFSAGKFEMDVYTSWSEGDMIGNDGRFYSSDLVFALSNCEYEN